MNYQIFYPADEHYNSAALENAKQLISKVRSLISVKATNAGDNQVWLGIWDAKPDNGSNPAATGTNNQLLDIAPVAGNGWHQMAVPGGNDLRNGLWVGAYTTAALALAGGAPDAGNVMFYRVDFTAPKIIPIN